MHKWFYETPNEFDNIILTSNGVDLTGLWFENSKDAKKHIVNYRIKNLPIFKETCKWLDIYFSGKIPSFTPKYKITHITPFRQKVQEIMLEIPYGKTISYGEIAERIAKKHNIPKMSARAVGSAVGWNPICLIIPCHRVVGTNKNFTGYSGGIKNKITLLKLEGIDLSNYIMPKSPNSKKCP